MTWRYRFILILFFISFFLVIARLFYWQVVKADELTQLGLSQYGKVIKTLPKRGEILTSDGYPIASNKVSYLVYANPKQIKQEDKNRLSSLLSPLLDKDTASISASLSQNLFWVPLKSSIDAQTKQKIEKLNVPGIGFEDEYSRFYPEASMAASLIGFVGKTETGEDKGYFGIEGYYDRQLSGRAGITMQVHDAFGRPIVAKIKEESGQINGRDIVLSLDRAIQFMVENKLKTGIESFQAVSGLVIVMDPKTGTILSMANFPSFDQNNYQEFDSALYRNPIVSNLYEPGSTFKSLVMASALDAKMVKPDTKCTICDGPISIGGYQIRTWNNQYYKNINMIDVIKHSDNTGMVFVSKSLGLNKMISYLQDFGIGSSTGIDIQGEVTATIRPKEEWYPIDLATASFGQGISVTPIELLSAFSAIANNGVRMWPHVVTKIQTDEGTIAISPKVVGKPISETTAKIMTEILVNAVDNGEAKWARIKGYRIAGKTGTAQIPIAGHYDSTKTIASFIGFAPADDPKFAMLVVIDRPTTSIYGAETAAPIFFDIARDLFSYYKIPPSE